MRSGYNFGIKKVLILMIAAAVAVLTSYYVRINAEAIALENRNAIIEYFENRLGRNLKYSTVDPFFVNSITIHDIEITDDLGRRLLKGDELKIRFNLFRYLFKKEFIISGVRLENGNINFIQAADSDIFFGNDSADNEETGNGKPARKLRNFRFSGKNITADFLTEYGSIRFERLYSNMTTTPETHLFDAHGTISGRNITLPVIGNFRTGFELKADLSRSNNIGDLDIDIKNFSSDVLNTGKLSLHAYYNDGNLEIRNVEDSTPIDYELRYYKESGRTEFRTVFENFRLSDNIVFVQKYQKYNRYAKGEANGNFSIVHTPKNVEKYAYSGDMAISFRNTNIPYRPECHLNFTGIDEKINFRALTMETDKGNGAYHGTIDIAEKSAEGDLLLDNFNIGNDIQVSTRFDISKSGDNTLLQSESLDINGYDLGSCTIKADTGSMKGELSVSKNGIRNLSIRGEQIPGKNYRGYITTERLDLKAAEAALNRNLIPGFIRMDLDSELFFITTGDNLYVSGRDLLVSDRNDRSNFLRFSVSSTLDDMSVNDIALKYGKAEGSGFLNITDMRKDTSLFRSIVSVNEINYEFKGFMNKGESLYLSGTPGFTLSAYFPDDKSSVFTCRTRDFPVYIKNCKSIFNLNINGSTEEGKLPAVNITNSSVSNLFFLRGSDNRITVNGNLRNNSLRLSSLRIKDAFSTVTGTGEGVFTDKANMGGWFRGTGSSPDEHYVINLSLKDNNIGLDAEIVNSRLERFIHIPVTGSLSGSVNVSGTMDSPEFSIDADIRKGTIFREPMEFATSISVTRDRSEIKSFNGYLGSVDILSTFGFIDWTEGIYNLDSNIVLNSKIDDSSAEALFSTSGIIEEEGSWIINPATTKNRGKMQLSSPSAVLIGYREWKFDYSNDGEIFTLNGGPYENSVSGRYFSDGNFDLNLKAPLFITGDVKGTLKDGYMDALINNAYVDLGSVGQLLKDSYFTPLSGNGVGTLRINGNINNPDIWGVLRADDIYFTLNSVPDILGPSSAEIFLQGKEISLQPLQIDLSKDNFAHVNAQFIHEHWALDYFNVNISVYGDPKKGTRITETFYGIDVDGYANGHISVAGSNRTYWVEGDVVVNNCIINMSKDFYDEPEESDDFYEFIVDMKLQSGTGVEFFWPTQKFPVLRAYADRNQIVTINFDSSAETFNIDGNVDFKGGDIFYFSNNFFIRDGQLFFHENQDKFDPRITVNAEMRTISRNNEKVKVLFILDNAPLSNFQPRIESVPALSQAELFELLGDTLMGGDPGDDERTTMTTLANASAYGTQLLGIFRPFERTVKDILNLDLFSIQAQLSDKIFNNRRNEEKSNVDMKQISATTYINNIDIFMGKYFGKYFFLDTTLRFSTWDFDTFEYYDYDMPVLGNMYIESEINFEAETPLFILNLGLYPKFGNIRDSMLDTTLGISWRLSY